MRARLRTWSALAVAVIVGATLWAGTAHAQTSVDFPLGIGFRLPQYDRVDGVTLPFGPTVSLGNERLIIDPLLTYRSNLGKFDPGLTVAYHLDSTFVLSATGSRGTFSNDRWIQSDILNSLRVLLAGGDTRNYFRADRTEGRLTGHFGHEDREVSLFGGVRFEDDWSTGWRDIDSVRGPFSFTHHHDTINGASRANPLIDRGHVASGIAGGTGTYKASRFAIQGDALVESAWHSPESTSTFTQLTLDERGLLRTLWGQRIEVNSHLVVTSGDSTPSQRYAYLGGGRTLPTEDLLSMGGDHLFLVDVSYVIPLHGVHIPALGTPSIQPRFVTGAAGVGHFGVPVRNIGGRVMVWLFQVDYLVNPDTHKHAFDAGIELPL